MNGQQRLRNIVPQESGTSVKMLGKKETWKKILGKMLLYMMKVTKQRSFGDVRLVFCHLLYL